jgi:hypothetical protein
MEEASDGSFLLSAKNRHGLEAYAPLAFRTVERSPRPSQKLKGLKTRTIRFKGSEPILHPSDTPSLHSYIHSRAMSCTHSSSTFRY